MNLIAILQAALPRPTVYEVPSLAFDDVLAACKAACHAAWQEWVNSDRTIVLPPPPEAVEALLAAVPDLLATLGVPK